MIVWLVVYVKNIQHSNDFVEILCIWFDPPRSRGEGLTHLGVHYVYPLLWNALDYSFQNFKVRLLKVQISQVVEVYGALWVDDFIFPYMFKQEYVHVD